MILSTFPSLIHSIAKHFMLVPGKRLQRPQIDPPIDNLPVEILCRIFELGAQDDFADRLSAFKHVTSASEVQDVLSSWSYYPAFQTSVCQVCTRWRDVALSTHPLWQTLLYNNNSAVARNRRYLERSGNSPLNILLVLQGQAISRGLSRTIGSWDSLGGDDLHSLDVVLSYIRPYMVRWRTLTVICHDYRSVIRLFSFFDINRPTSLRDISVNYLGRPPILGFSELPLQFAQEQARSPETLFLRAVLFPWSRLVPEFFNNLRELHLVDIDARIYPKLWTLKRIVQLSPRLETLWLENSDRRTAAMLTEFTQPDEGIQPVHVPSLRNITILGLGYRYTSAVLHLLQAPEFFSLVFDCKGELSNYDFFLNSLSCSCNPLLKRVRSLSLVGAKCSSEAAHLFLGQLENVESLQLSGSISDTNRFFMALLDNSDRYCALRIRSSFDDLSEPYCPRLQEIKTEGIPLKLTAMFAEARLRGHHPLKTVIIRARDSASDRDWKLWLRRNVEVFEHFVKL